MNPSCKTCWRYEVCTQEEKEEAEAQDFPCWDPPDNSDQEFERLREKERNL